MQPGPTCPSHHHPFRMPVTWVLQLIATLSDDLGFLAMLLPPSQPHSQHSNFQTLCSFLLLQEEVRHGAVLVRHGVFLDGLLNHSIRVSLVPSHCWGRRKLFASVITEGLRHGVGVGYCRYKQHR